MNEIMFLSYDKSCFLTLVSVAAEDAEVNYFDISEILWETCSFLIKRNIHDIEELNCVAIKHLSNKFYENIEFRKALRYIGIVYKLGTWEVEIKFKQYKNSFFIRSKNGRYEVYYE